MENETSTFFKFPKIGQFRETVKRVKERQDFKGLDDDGNAIRVHDSDYPILRFRGTPKMHGSNGAIVIENGEIRVQSRTRIITPTSDNAGFAQFVSSLSKEVIESLPNNVSIFGEWCGGNIQKGIALNELPKMFVIFGIKTLDESASWMDLNEMTFDLLKLNDNNVFVITQFPSFSVSIDFNNPELSQNELSELTQQVENECPVGKYFNVTGVGEGIVWTNDSNVSDSSVWFKVKGEKHSVTKVKTLASVDVEKLNSIKEFVDITVTDARLQQGLDYIKEQQLEIHRKNTGTYLRWMFNDIISEELDTLTANNLEVKDVGGAISNKARVFWFNKTDN